MAGKSKGVVKVTEVRSVGDEVREAITGVRRGRVTVGEGRVGRRAVRMEGRTVERGPSSLLSEV